LLSCGVVERSCDPVQISPTIRTAQPFDIRNFQMTLVELSNSAQELTKLSDSLERISDKVVANQLITQIENALGAAEKKVRNRLISPCTI